MLMAMQPIWENDFHNLSYGFRPERSVHHAIRTVKLQLTDTTDARGRWVIEGDLASYFDTVHHRLLMKSVRKRSRYGDMRIYSMIPKEKARKFRKSLAILLSGNHGDAGVDVVRKLNARLLGWSTFYRFVDNRAVVFSRIDRAVFWKFAHWMVRKYRCRIKSLLMRWVKSPEPKASKTWVLYDTVQGQHRRADLQRLVGRSKCVFWWRGPSVNPYLRTDERKTITSRYTDVAIAMSNA